MQPHIVISGDPLRPPLTGIGRYTKELIRALVERHGLDRLHVYAGSRPIPATLALAQSTSEPEPQRSMLRSKLRALPGSYEMYHQLRGLWFRRWSRPFDLYHEPSYVLKPFHGAAVVTVHDLSHVVFPALHPCERVRFLDRHLPQSLLRAQRILVVSDFTRRELMRLFDVPAEKIIVTPLAAGPEFRPLSEDETGATLHRFGLRRHGFLLALATLEPRKNLGALLTAYMRLPRKTRRAYPLVLAGTMGWRTSLLKDQIDRLSRQGEIRQLGYVADTDLPALLSSCRALVYPSLYEGFGLPVLEAQACGAAVITSARAALPEVAGPTTILLDPEDIVAMSEAIARLCDDDAFIERAARLGPEFANRFSWQRTAALTAKAYAEALNCR